MRNANSGTILTNLPDDRCQGTRLGPSQATKQIRFYVVLFCPVGRLSLVGHHRRCCRSLFTVQDNLGAQHLNRLPDYLTTSFTHPVTHLLTPRRSFYLLEPCHPRPYRHRPPRLLLHLTLNLDLDLDNWPLPLQGSLHPSPNPRPHYHPINPTHDYTSLQYQYHYQ